MPVKPWAVRGDKTGWWGPPRAPWVPYSQLQITGGLGLLFCGSAQAVHRATKALQLALFKTPTHPSLPAQYTIDFISCFPLLTLVFVVHLKPFLFIYLGIYRRTQALFTSILAKTIPRRISILSIIATKPPQNMKRMNQNKRERKGKIDDRGKNYSIFHLIKVLVNKDDFNTNAWI